MQNIVDITIYKLNRIVHISVSSWLCTLAENINIYYIINNNIAAAALNNTNKNVQTFFPPLSKSICSRPKKNEKKSWRVSAYAAPPLTFFTPLAAWVAVTFARGLRGCLQGSSSHTQFDSLWTLPILWYFSWVRAQKEHRRYGRRQRSKRAPSAMSVTSAVAVNCTLWSPRQGVSVLSLPVCVCACTILLPNHMPYRHSSEPNGNQSVSHLMPQFFC